MPRSRTYRPAATGVLLVLVVACWSNSACAQSLPCSKVPAACDILVPVLVIGAGAAATVLAINGYETVLDIDDASRGRSAHSGRAHFETAWGGWQAGTGLVALSLVTPALADDFENVGEPFFGIALATSWPLAMTTHGAWAGSGAPPNPHAFGWLVPLGLVDAGPLGFDAWQTACGARPGRVYSSIEIGVSAIQLAYGAGVVRSAAPSDRAVTLGASTLPAMLLVHGFYALALGERKTDARAPHGASWYLAPTVHSETGVGTGVSVYGQF